MKLEDLAKLMGVSVEEVKEELNKSDVITLNLSDKGNRD